MAADGAAAAAGGPLPPGVTAGAGGAPVSSRPSPPGPAGLVIWAAAVNSVFLQLSDAVAQGGVVQEMAMV